ncbi:MAG: hypothetical protein O7D95_02960 [Betaproteobacteria bacterium]|nr:hypothetical protein [Betaproteobacteria bacterium]
MKTKELENYKLSQWVELALDDLKKVERSPKYSIDMGTWHEPNGTCAVCMAGSIMAKTLGADIELDVMPDDYSDKIRRALEAIDYIRVGNIMSAIKVFTTTPIHDFDVMSYDDDKNLWRQDMRKIIKMLKAAGL